MIVGAVGRLLFRLGAHGARADAEGLVIVVIVISVILAVIFGVIPSIEKSNREDLYRKEKEEEEEEKTRKLKAYENRIEIAKGLFEEQKIEQERIERREELKESGEYLFSIPAYCARSKFDLLDLQEQIRVKSYMEYKEKFGCYPDPPSFEAE